MSIEPIYRLPKVIELTGMTKSSINIGIKNGGFPKPIKLGNTRCNGWPESVIDKWNQEMKERIND